MISLTPIVLLLQAICLVNAAPSPSQPTATVKNGTYSGTHIGGNFNVNQFLGVKFANAPRFQRAVSLNETWSGIRTATAPGFDCPQAHSFGYKNMGEDCLNMNIYQPAGANSSEGLPVLVWIFGGGLFTGSPNLFPNYNMTYIVKKSVDIGTPIVAVAINYRVNVFGFISSQEVADNNATNIGMYDQRFALHWIQENIAGFGGDPTKVTVWGQSAGAQSIGFQTLAYGGRDDGLYRGAIMDSGGAIATPIEPLAFYTEPYRNLTRFVGCSTVASPLKCLKSVPLSKFLDYLDTILTTFVWNPVFDDEFFQTYPSDLLNEGSFPRIALLAGANRDEGATFGVKGLNTTWDLFSDLLVDRGFALTPRSINRLLELYPNDPAIEPPGTYPNDTIFPQNGLQWRRSGSLAGDYTIHAPRRKHLRSYLAHAPELGSKLFSYRWDTVPIGQAPINGASHGVELAFIFGSNSTTIGSDPRYISISDLAQRSWIAFAATQNPNNNGVAGAARWPSYSEGSNGLGVNLIWDVDKGNYAAPDTYREDGIGFMNSISREFLS